MAGSCAPPSFQEMHYKIQCSGSEAAAFGELVELLQSRLSSTAIGGPVESVHATHRRVPAHILNMAVHLCLLATYSSHFAWARRVVVVVSGRSDMRGRY